MRRRPHAARKSAHIWKVSKNVFVDVENDMSRKGRHVNDGGRSGRANNAVMSKKRSLNVCKETGERWTSIVAKTNIKAPAEMFMSCGRVCVCGRKSRWRR